MYTRFYAILLTLAFAGGTASAQQALDDIGVLTCNVAEGAPQATGEGAATGGDVRDMLCTFRPQARGPEETYEGTVQVISGSQEPFASRVLMYAVKAAEASTSPGLLQQTYSMDAAGAPGPTAPLIGETRKLIVLQSLAEKAPGTPMTAQAQPPGAMVLAVALKLRSAPA